MNLIEFVDKTQEKSGTPLNRANLMALQGFISSKVVFNADGSIVETNSLGQKKTTVFQGENVIVETFVGEKTLVKTTTINSDGTITEEIS